MMENLIEFDPPAFPSVRKMSDGTEMIFNGMTLRDYFAAKAMAAFTRMTVKGQHSIYDYIAEQAYAQADAMLAVREVK